MKIASILACYLVGLIFTGFGLNGFLNFIHQPPANPLPIQFLVSVGESDFAAFFFAIHFLGGVQVEQARYQSCRTRQWRTS
jgi:putative oxidoreductase